MNEIVAFFGPRKPFPLPTLRYYAVVVTLIIPTGGNAQSLTVHPQIVISPQGQMELSITNARPLAEAVTAIRRKYGWVVDYEESEPSPSELYYDRDGYPRLLTQHIGMTLPPADTPSVGGVPAQLAAIAQQFSSSTRSVKVDTPSAFRFSIATVAAGGWLLLDTPITLPNIARPIDATVTAICDAAAAAHDTSCTRGGLIDSELMRTTVSIGSDRPVAARRLLAEALDMARHRKVWMLCYEPSEHQFVLGIQPAVYVVAGGEVMDLPQIPGSN